MRRRSLAVEALVGVVRPDLLPETLRELREGKDVPSGGIEVLERVGQFPLDIIQQPLENCACTAAPSGLVHKTGVQHRLDRRPHLLFGVADMRFAAVSWGAATLPAGAGGKFSPRSRPFESGVSVGGDQTHPQ